MSEEEDFFDISEISRLAESEGQEYLSEVSAFYTTLEQAPLERYQDKVLIGEGSLKSVYSCYDARMRRRVAFAQPREGLSVDYYDLFIYEAWLTASLQHPNILKVYDLNLDSEGVPFFTMDLKGKTTLKTLLDDQCSRTKSIEVLLKVCDAISYAHAQGVIHLDLKPENILCEAHGEVLVCDWGIGKVLEQSGREVLIVNEELTAVGRTLHGQVKGSPGFMSPEQANQAEKDERSDLYALGALLYCMMLGHPPYKGSVSDILSQTRKGQWDELSLKQAKLPRELQAVILKALQLHPEDRYQTVQSFQHDLSLYLAGFRTRAERPSFLLQSLSFLKRHRAKVAILVLAMGTVSVVSLNYEQSQKQLRQEASLSQAEKEILANEIDKILENQQEFDQVIYGGSENKVLFLLKKIKDLVDPTMIASNRNLDYHARHRKAEYFVEQLFYHGGNGASYAQRLDCHLMAIKLDFKKVLEKYPEVVPSRTGVTYRERAYVKLRPDWDFDEGEYPSAADLCVFFRQARQVSTKDSDLMLAIFRYASQFPYSIQEYNQVLVEVLRYVGGENNSLICTYDEERLSLRLEFTEDYIPGTIDRNLVILSCLKLRELKIISPYAFDLVNLSGSSIGFLDLSGCPLLKIRQRITIGRLSEITLPPNTLTPEVLQTNLTTRPMKRPYKVITAK